MEQTVGSYAKVKSSLQCFPDFAAQSHDRSIREMSRPENFYLVCDFKHSHFSLNPSPNLTSIIWKTKMPDS